MQYQGKNKRSKETKVPKICSLRTEVASFVNTLPNWATLPIFVEKTYSISQKNAS